VPTVVVVAPFTPQPPISPTPPSSPTPTPTPTLTPTPTPTPSATPALPGPNVLTFSGFDDPPAPAGGYTTFCSPPTCAASSFSGGWVAMGEGVDLSSAVLFPVPVGDPSGTQSVDLNGPGPNTALDGGIARTVTTLAGATYRLTFALAGNGMAGPAVKTGSVLVAGVDVLDFSFDTSGHDTSSAAAMGWATQYVDFVAASTSTPLYFRSTTLGSGGPLITDVTLNQIA
jgi:hypothetical protein